VGTSRTNWAGNIAYTAPDFRRPDTVSQLRAVVARAGRIRVLATGHSFNDMADSPGTQVSLGGLPPEVELDAAAARVRVAAGLSYATLAGRLDRHGFALRNLASLPHISVAGACATGTHGSGTANQSLAAAVAALEFVTADGDLTEVRRTEVRRTEVRRTEIRRTEIRRQDAPFPGAVVHLGALGVVTRLILDVVPSFEVSQRVYEELPLDVLDDHFAELMSAGYSVSLFTDWRAPRLTQIWIKQRLGDTYPEITEAPWFTARPAPGPRNPVPDLPPANCTEQLGVPGPWLERLPHFRPGFTPSAGDELQTEYLLPVEHAGPALRALNQVSERVAAVLQICEIRAVAADDLWLSPCYRRDSVALHFTWRLDTAAVRPVVRLLERQLAPFAARPHWGKVFTASADDLRARYDRLPDFLRLMNHFDPAGKFRNAYTDRYLLG